MNRALAQKCLKLRPLRSFFYTLGFARGTKIACLGKRTQIRVSWVSVRRVAGLGRIGIGREMREIVARVRRMISSSGVLCVILNKCSNLALKYWEFSLKNTYIFR